MSISLRNIADSVVDSSNVTSFLLKTILNLQKPKEAKMIANYQAYNVESLPIMNRTVSSSNPLAANNKVINSYRSKIVDTFRSYFVGVPPKYQLDKNKYDESQYSRNIDTIGLFNLTNFVEDLDGELAKMAGICGYCPRLVFIDQLGEPSILNLDPWEVIFLERSDKTVKYAVRHYTTYSFKDEEIVPTIHIEWYDDQNIYYFIQDEDDFIPDSAGSPSGNVKAHLFPSNPMLKLKNNEEELGDFDRVVTLIDSYDNHISNNVNELDNFNNAIMTITTDDEPLTVEETNSLKSNKILYLSAGSKAEFVTKNINDTFSENTKRTLNQNIFKFSGAVDTADESFTGGSEKSGYAQQLQMQSMGTVMNNKELKFISFMRSQFKLLCYIWGIKNVANINYLDIFVDFTRNLPSDAVTAADTVVKLKSTGIVSNRTLLSMLPIVDDVDYEINLLSVQNEDVTNVPPTTVPL